MGAGPVRPSRRDPLGLFFRLAREGDVARFRLGRQEAFFVSHPDGIQEVLVERNRSFVKQKVARASWLGPPRYRAGRGLILSDDMDTHVVGRRVVQPAFRSERIASSGALVVEEAVRARNRWQDGATIDVEREMA